MAEPIVFIARFRVREGRLDDFRKHYMDSREVTVVRLFPDAEAMDAQLQGSAERSQKTYEFVEPVRMEIYGTPSPSAMEMMKKAAEKSAGLSVNARFK
jgi:hypothetical protein